VITDFWKAYDAIPEEMFLHLKINHSIEFVSAEDSSIHTNTIEGCWKLAKASLPSQGYISESMKFILRVLSLQFHS
jgi:hypothetical protein